MPAYERSAVMARGYPGFADGRSRTEFEGVKKNSASAKNLQILRAIFGNSPVGHFRVITFQ